MKKVVILMALSFSALAIPSYFNQAKADICVPSDPDFDAADCAANGGTPGTPIGIGGGPGGPGGGSPTGTVPIDGGLTAMLVLGGAAGAKRFFSKKK